MSNGSVVIFLPSMFLLGFPIRDLLTVALLLKALKVARRRAASSRPVPFLLHVKFPAASKNDVAR
jgi:hypothetical protein